jgi:hypothetical protein
LGRSRAPTSAAETLFKMELMRCAVANPQLLVSLLALHQGDRCALCKALPLSAALLTERRNPTAGSMSLDNTPQQLRKPRGNASPEILSSQLHRFLMQRPFHERGELLCELTEEERSYRPLLTLLLLEHGSEVLAPLLVTLGSRPAAASRLAAVTLAVIEDLVELKGIDVDEWSQAARWLARELSGFLSPSVLAERVPLTLLLDTATPGIAPCRFPVVCYEIDQLKPEQLRTFFALTGEWCGSLRDLVLAARAL